MKPLNISLSGTQSKIKGRLAIAVLCLGIFFTAWLVLRIHRSIDTTSWLMPEGTAYTIHLPMNPQMAKRLSENIGNEQLFTQRPLSIDHLVRWCTNSCSIHMDQLWNVRGIALDYTFTETQIAIIEAAGLFVELREGKSLILMESDTIASAQQHGSLIFSELLPWNHATLIDRDASRNISISVHENRLIVRTRTDIESPHQHTFDETVRVFAQLSISAPQWSTTARIVPSLVQKALQEIGQEPISLALGMNEDGGIVYSIQTSAALEEEKIAEISHELIKPAYLSTLEWTISDGTTLDEIRFDDSTIELNTYTKEGVFFLEVKKGSQTLLRITQADGRTIFSNTGVSLTNSNTSSSQCVNSAERFIRPAALIEAIADTRQPFNPTFLGALSLFDEADFLPNKVVLCW